MWAVIITLILVGMILVVLEILVIPGVGITGILGFLLMVAGVWTAYARNGSSAGNATLLITILVSTLSMIVILRSKTWKRAQLKTAVSGKVRTFDTLNLKPGMQGETVSRCAPMGKAVFNGHHVEVDAGTSFLGTGTKVEITRIEGNKIFIKHLTT